MNALLKGVVLIPLTLNMAMAASHSFGEGDRVMCNQRQGHVKGITEDDKIKVAFDKYYNSHGFVSSTINYTQLRLRSECINANSLVDSNNELPSRDNSSDYDVLKYKLKERVICDRKEGHITDLRADNKIEVKFEKYYSGNGVVSSKINYSQLLKPDQCKSAASLVSGEDELSDFNENISDELLKYKLDGRVTCGNREGRITDLRADNKIEVKFEKYYSSNGVVSSKINYSQLLNPSECQDARSLVENEDELPSRDNSSDYDVLKYKLKERVMCDRREGHITDLRADNKIEVKFEKYYSSNGVTSSKINYSQLLKPDQCKSAVSLVSGEDELSDFNEDMSGEMSKFKLDGRVTCGNREGLIIDLRADNKIKVKFYKIYSSNGVFSRKLNYSQLLHPRECQDARSLVDSEDDLIDYSDELGKGLLKFSLDKRVMCDRREGHITDIRADNKIEVKFEKHYSGNGVVSSRIDYSQLLTPDKCTDASSLINVEDEHIDYDDEEYSLISEEILKYKHGARVMCDRREGHITDIRADNKIEVKFYKSYRSNGIPSNKLDYSQLLSPEDCEDARSLIQSEDELMDYSDELNEELLSFKLNDRVMCDRREGFIADIRVNNTLDIKFEKYYNIYGSSYSSIDYSQLIKIGECRRVEESSTQE